MRGIVNACLEAAGSRKLPSGPIVQAMRLEGQIGGGQGGNRISVAAVDRLVEKAYYRKKDVAAVALMINSQGGAAAQSHLVFEAIKNAREATKIPTFAFVEDVAASGGYLIACAADKIIIDPMSVVGSIGVMSPNFGVEKALEKLGLEWRGGSAGQKKVFNNPFGPQTEEQKARVKAMIEEIHHEFKASVLASRGDRLEQALKSSKPVDRTGYYKKAIKSVDDLLEGDIFVGRDAVAFGLADEIGQMRPFLARELKCEAKDLRINKVSPGFGPWGSMMSASSASISHGLGRGIASELFDRTNFAGFPTRS